MYCDSNGNNLISSPNYPNSNYPDNQNKEYPIKVATGSIIEILFTDFNLEAHASCAYDWVQVLYSFISVLEGHHRCNSLIIILYLH